LKHQTRGRDHRLAAELGRVAVAGGQGLPLGPTPHRTVEREGEQAGGVIGGDGEILLEPWQAFSIERAAGVAIHDQLAGRQFGERRSRASDPAERRLANEIRWAGRIGKTPEAQDLSGPRPSRTG
jgi:hypothetical protein